MLQAVPADADTHLLKALLHDWLDDDCESILRICRAAMSTSSVVLIVERPPRRSNRARTRKASAYRRGWAPYGTPG
jgi:O-methyltransferase domain